ncbi:MAG: hypothetical protein LBS52_06240 [Dysgonamonadaceae bacterium]|jgi:hypothetical protein|nr:hypothetical protein [Dysgonamonadaceae bacterium]
MPRAKPYNRFTGASMFSSTGIAEQYFSDVGIDIVDNLGKDISHSISDLTLSKFATAGI